LRLHLRLAGIDLRPAASAELLDRLSPPSLLVDATARVPFANRAAEGILADPRAEEWMDTNWGGTPASDPATIPPLLPESGRVRLGTWIGVANAVLAIDNTERLKASTAPTLVIWG
jgi:pimeloyl-ACP methyl ester carboxylesterase